MSVLIIFCQNYPFSHGEHLLSEEIKEHLGNFEKVFLVSADISTNQQYEVDSRVKIHRFSPRLSFIDIIRYAFKIFSKIIFFELNYICKNYNRKDIPILIKKAIAAYVRAKKYQHFCESTFLDESPKTIVFYSWWITDATLGFCFLKENNSNLDINIFSRARAIDLYLYRHQPQYLPFRNYIFDKLDRTFSISNEGRQYILNTFDSSEESKVETSYIGVLGPNKLEKYQFTQPLILVSCSGVIPLKRIDYIVDSLSLINNYSIHWIHFGDGIDMEKTKDYAYNKFLKKNNISFAFKGYWSNIQLMEYYKENRIDLFINLSQFEGVPVSIMEAFSFGIPTITNDVGGISEMVNNKNGYLIDVKRQPELVSSIIQDFIELNNDEKNEFRRSAYNTWKEKFHLQKNFSNLSSIMLNIDKL